MRKSGYQIKQENFADPAIKKLLQEHLQDMHKHTPAEGVFALDLDALKQPQVSFYCLRLYGMLMACGALNEFLPTEAEIKSMRTQHFARNKGVASFLLSFIIMQAKERQYKRLYLETGNMAFFTPAIALYRKHGFVDCGPFSDYKQNETSHFMQLAL